MRTETMTHPVQTHFLGQTQLQAQNVCGVGKQKVVDESKRPSIKSSVSDSSLYSETHVIYLIDPKIQNGSYYANFSTEPKRI